MKTLLSVFVVAGLVGCSANRTVRQFDVPFATANARVQTLYPSSDYRAVSSAQAANTARLDGPLASVRRDEVSRRDEVRWLVSEGTADAIARRTTILLAQRPGNRSEVSVQTSTAKGDVLLPTRDRAYEAARLEEIANAIRR